MALTASRTHVEVFGGKQIFFYDLTFTGVTGGEVQTGMANVVQAFYTPTKTDDHGKIHHNYSDAGTTVKAGSVYVDGVTDADTGKLMVVGTA